MGILSNPAIISNWKQDWNRRVVGTKLDDFQRILSDLWKLRTATKWTQTWSLSRKPRQDYLEWGCLLVIRPWRQRRIKLQQQIDFDSLDVNHLEWPWCQPQWPIITEIEEIRYQNVKKNMTGTFWRDAMLSTQFCEEFRIKLRNKTILSTKVMGCSLEKWTDAGKKCNMDLDSTSGDNHLRIASLRIGQ
jgi:hypothetical protein